MKRGIALLEMVLALTIFSLVVVALARSLQAAVEATTLQQKEHQIQERLRSHLDWIKVNPKDQERLKEIELKDGTRLKSIFEPYLVKNEEGNELQNLFLLKVEAHIPHKTQPTIRSVQLILYAP